MHRAEPESIAACRRLGHEVDWPSLEPPSAYWRFVRPILNVLLGALALPVVLVLCSLVALANAAAFRSFRKVFFRQPRVGYRGRLFRIWKFRTMDELPGSQMSCWSSGDDALLVTRFGRFLRSTHLDELPQMLNILRGEMTFIGPRPEMIEIEDWARGEAPGFERRLALKPGITGLAQITQGYTVQDRAAYVRKLALNERYRAEVSLRLDLGIILGTVVWMVRGRGWAWRSAQVDAASDGPPPIVPAAPLDEAA